MENRLTTWWKDHGPSKRRLIQLYSALLYNANLKGFVKGQIYTGNSKAVCVPGFNCYSCPGAVGACPLGSLQASLGSANKQAGFYILGIFLLYGLIAGRTICGWICPLGLIQELLHKIPVPKIRKSRVTRALSYLKYVLLVIFVVIVSLYYGLKHSMAVPGFCKYICPAGTFEGAMGLLSNPKNSGYFGMLGIIFTRKFIIMLAIGLACVFCYRAFCRFLCPLGALYGMFNQLALIGVKVDITRCNGCGSCVRNCKMDVKKTGDHECIHCGYCMEKCPQGAISIKAGSFTLKAPAKGCADDTDQLMNKRKKVEKYAWIIAIAILVLALLWYNFLDPSGKKGSKKTSYSPEIAAGDPVDTVGMTDAAGEADLSDLDEDDILYEEEDPLARYNSDAPIGYNKGERLSDFTVDCLDGSTFTLSEYRGKVVIINLWATWCGPCVEELPAFNGFYEKHRDDVAVLACHSSFTNEDVAEYVSAKGWDKWGISFVYDSNETVFSAVNGSMVLPQTIVLNRKGEVVYNEIRSVNPEMLEKLYEQASKEVESPSNRVPRADESDKADEDIQAAQAEEDGNADVVEIDIKGPALSETETYTSTAPFGYNEGERLKDFTITCLDGSEFVLSDHRGKVVIINLWGSFSQESINGLGVLDEFCKAHNGDIAAIAVHYRAGILGVSDIAEGISLPVAVDDKDGKIFKLTGGSMVLPRTIVLNKSGEVVYNSKGVLTQEELEDIFMKASEK